MGIRSVSRELSLQMLFYADVSCYNNWVSLLLFYKEFPLNKRVKQFFHRLVEGVWKHTNDIDFVIKKYSNNWKMYRMSCVDRNILRLAVYELLYCNDIPYKVSINEAINLAKKFSTGKSGAFANGILNTVYLALIADKS